MPAVRVDDVVTRPDGSVELLLTTTMQELPAEPSGQGMVYGSKQDLIDDIRHFTNQHITMILLANWLKADPTLSKPPTATRRSLVY